MDGAESAVSHGWLFARPVGAINLKIAQRPAGLIIREKDFCLLFARGLKRVKSRSA
jgi:hypothetical protein